MADCLDHLAGRGWAFMGSDSDGQAASIGLGNRAPAAELHGDLAALPAPLRAWLARQVLLLRPVGADAADGDTVLEAYWTPNAWRTRDVSEVLGGR